ISNYLLVRKAGTSVSWSPEAGTAYTNGEALGDGHTVVVAAEDGLAYMDNSVSNGTTYHYALFAFDGMNNYSVGLSSSTTPAPVDVTPPQIQNITTTTNSGTYGANAANIVINVTFDENVTLEVGETIRMTLNS